MSLTTQPADTEERVRPGWWDEPFQVFQTNLREIDAGLDVDSVGDRRCRDVEACPVVGGRNLPHLRSST